MNYEQRFVTLYRRQGSSPSPRKRKAKKKDDLEGWYGEGGRRGFQDWEQVSVHPRRIHDDIWQNQYNIVK